MNIQPVGYRFERIAMDLCGPLEESNNGHKYILVISDYFSKYTMAIPLKDKTKEEVARVLLRQ